jgi:hypothetical protein
LLTANVKGCNLVPEPPAKTIPFILFTYTCIFKIDQINNSLFI